jgi:hypothetical protein
MNHDHWTDQLSAYLDDDLSREDRLALDGHLLGCAACRQTLSELGDVAAAARSLEPDTPAPRLWRGVAARLGESSTVRPHRHQRIPPVGILAAGVLLAITSVMIAWLLMNRPPTAEFTEVTEEPSMRPVSVATVPYGHAVEDLMITLNSRRDQLSPRTVQVLERSLATIDQSIADAIEVLREHPDDLALVQRVADQRRMKLAVLRQVERLTAAQEQ